MVQENDEFLVYTYERVETSTLSRPRRSGRGIFKKGEKWCRKMTSFLSIHMRGVNLKCGSGLIHGELNVELSAHN